MSKLDEALKSIVENVDGAVARGVVGLSSGVLMGLHNASNYPTELNDLVAAATMDLFRGRHLQDIQKMVRRHRGVAEDAAKYFEEIHIVSAHNFHFAKTLKGGAAAMMLVTKKTPNIGMGWAKLIMSVPDVEASF